jgi:hypothetical protein
MSGVPPPLEYIGQGVEHLNISEKHVLKGVHRKDFPKISDGATPAAENPSCKKGFLLKDPTLKQAASGEPGKRLVSKSETVSNARCDSSSPWVFPEVQAAMKPEWITPDFLDKVLGNPDLREALSDPSFLELLTIMKSDPTRGKEIMTRNKQLQCWVSKMLSALGDHFEVLANTKDTPESITEAGSLTSVERAENQLLSDPIIKQVIGYIQDGEKVELRDVLRKYPYIEPKLKRLIEAGYMKLVGDVNVK